jgi:phospholipase C
MRQTGLAVSAREDLASGLLWLTLSNDAAQSVDATVHDGASRVTMRLAAGQQVAHVIDTARTAGWYDLEITAPNFEYALSGRVVARQPSVA